MALIALALYQTRLSNFIATRKLPSMVLYIVPLNLIARRYQLFFSFWSTSEYANLHIIFFGFGIFLLILNMKRGEGLIIAPLRAFPRVSSYKFTTP